MRDSELREIACRHAAVEAAMDGPAKEYYSFPFTPHKWVVEAMKEVLERTRNVENTVRDRLLAYHDALNDDGV